MIRAAQILGRNCSPLCIDGLPLQGCPVPGLLAWVTGFGARRLELKFATALPAIAEGPPPGVRNNTAHEQREGRIEMEAA
jgi:hypothetical protein